MRQVHGDLALRTAGQGLIEITGPVAGWLAAQAPDAGLLTVHCRHTSASLLIQENADPDVCADLEDFFRRLVREEPQLYRHVSEGADDMPAHIRAALTQSTLSLPVVSGRMALGTWQGLYLFEHRMRPHQRRLALHFIGE